MKLDRYNLSIIILVCFILYNYSLSLSLIKDKQNNKIKTKVSSESISKQSKNGEITKKWDIDQLVKYGRNNNFTQSILDPENYLTATDKIKLEHKLNSSDSSFISIVIISSISDNFYNKVRHSTNYKKFTKYLFKSDLFNHSEMNSENRLLILIAMKDLSISLHAGKEFSKNLYKIEKQIIIEDTKVSYLKKKLYFDACNYLIGKFVMKFQQGNKSYLIHNIIICFTLFLFLFLTVSLGLLIYTNFCKQVKSLDKNVVKEESSTSNYNEKPEESTYEKENDNYSKNLLVNCIAPSLQSANNMNNNCFILHSKDDMSSKLNNLKEIHKELSSNTHSKLSEVLNTYCLICLSKLEKQKNESENILVVDESESLVKKKEINNQEENITLACKHTIHSSCYSKLNNNKNGEDEKVSCPICSLIELKDNFLITMEILKKQEVIEESLAGQATKNTYKVYVTPDNLAWEHCIDNNTYTFQQNNKQIINITNEADKAKLDDENSHKKGLTCHDMCIAFDIFEVLSKTTK